MKLKLRIAFAATAVLAALAALAFFNNVFALVGWWRLFLAAGGDTANVPSHVAGCIPWLDWSAVDYSAVTTLIPLIGFTCLARAAWRLLRGRFIRPDDFPFFRGSDQLHIALGLFGTLWGIIVIGYFKLDTVTMADLMQCLHTALFSTLMAVVWVFFIDRPLARPYFQRLLAKAGLTEADTGDLAAGVDRLVRRMDEACETFTKRQREFEAETLARRAALDEELRAYRVRLEAEVAARLKAMDDEAAARKRVHDEEMCAAHEAFAKREAANAESFSKREAANAEAFAKRIADYEAECDERQREYVEVFKRRLAELEGRAEAAEKRAETADARVADIAKIARSWN